MERAPGLRSSGNPVDVRGPALAVAEPDGHHAPPARGRHPGDRDAAWSTLPAGRSPGSRMPAAAAPPATGRSSCPAATWPPCCTRPPATTPSSSSTTPSPRCSRTRDGVDVTFDAAAARRFDLVVGADGLHSTVRRLAFGPERDFVRHMGVYVATMPLGGPVERPHDVVLYNTPGRLVSIHPSRGEALAAFIFRGPAVAGFDHRDTEQHKRIVTEAYAGAGWRVPELLERLREGRGPLLRLGQPGAAATPGRAAASRCSATRRRACRCSATAPAWPWRAPTPSPRRSPRTRPTTRAAFRRYETEHRSLVAPKQRHIGRAAALLIPKTRLGIAARNLAARAWPSRR